jgi:peptidyl-prolyl cis-trans isomerase A (cyclophilin A)
MKLNRKTILTIIVLFLFSGSVISIAANIFIQTPKVTQIAVLETNKGTIEIELNSDKAPITVANFVKYVNSGFYNGTVFHRVVKGFVIQGGGFDTNDTYKEGFSPIQSEANNGLKNLRGTIAMARSTDPNSATSQFYINTVDNPGLDYPNPDGYGYTVFGKVVQGMDVVDQIEVVNTTTVTAHYLGQDIPSQDWPIENIVITGSYIIAKK